jgi:hypothetical protein
VPLLAHRISILCESPTAIVRNGPPTTHHTPHTTHYTTDALHPRYLPTHWAHPQVRRRNFPDGVRARSDVDPCPMGGPIRLQTVQKRARGSRRPTQQNTPSTPSHTAPSAISSPDNTSHPVSDQFQHNSESVLQPQTFSNPRITIQSLCSCGQFPP